MTTDDVRAGSLTDLQKTGRLLTKVGALPVVVLAQGMDTLCDMRLKSAEDTALRIVASSETVSAGAL